jgi:hypothetical protein
MKDFYKHSRVLLRLPQSRTPAQLNDYKWQRAIFLYDEWQNSPPSPSSRRFPSTSRTPSPPARPATCNAKPSASYPTTAPRTASSPPIAGSAPTPSCPKFYNYDEQAEKTHRAFLQNNVFNVDIFALEQWRRPTPAPEPAGHRAARHLSTSPSLPANSSPPPSSFRTRASPTATSPSSATCTSPGSTSP